MRKAFLFEAAYGTTRMSPVRTIVDFAEEYGYNNLPAAGLPPLQDILGEDGPFKCRTMGDALHLLDANELRQWHTAPGAVSLMTAYQAIFNKAPGVGLRLLRDIGEERLRQSAERHALNQRAQGSGCAFPPHRSVAYSPSVAPGPGFRSACVLPTGPAGGAAGASSPPADEGGAPQPPADAAGDDPRTAATDLEDLLDLGPFCEEDAPTFGRGLSGPPAVRGGHPLSPAQLERLLDVLGVDDPDVVLHSDEYWVWEAPHPPIQQACVGPVPEQISKFFRATQAFCEARGRPASGAEEQKGAGMPGGP